MKIAREAYPESQDVPWVEHNLLELRTEILALGDFEKLKAKGEALESQGLDKVEAVKLAEFDELINPCLAFDFESRRDAQEFLERFMTTLLAKA